MIKKNFHGGLKLFLLLLFMHLFVGSFTLCNAYTSIQDPHLEYSEMRAIIEELEITNFSGDAINVVTDTYNRWVTVMLASNYDFQLSNIIFYKNSGSINDINWVLNNGTVGSYPYIAIGRYSDFSGTLPSTLTGTTYLATFNNFVYNSSGDTTGINVGNLTRYYINISNRTVVSQSNTHPSIQNSNTNPTTVNNDEIYIHYAIAFFKPTSVVYSRTTDYGGKSFFLGHILDLGRTTDGITPPTPTPTPGGGGGSSPGGGGEVDLTETNGKIDDVKDAVDQQGEAIVAQLSGDKAEIIESQQQSTEAITSSIDDAFDPDTSKIDSGDIDLSTNDFEISAEDDPTSNFFTWLLEQIQDILTTDSVETLEFDFLDEHYTLSSDFFTIDEGALKTFLQAYFTFAVGLATALDIRHIIEQFKNGNIEAIASDDINANIV